MNEIYEVIQLNPEFFAWSFGVVNVLWVLFTYFNKQSHEREMVNLVHKLNLDAERRKKVFELKASQYELYVSMLDEFGKKNQVDMPKRMQPILERFLKDYLFLSESGDKAKEQELIAWLSNQVNVLTQEGLEDLLKLKAESNRLKLTATDEMIETFYELEELITESVNKTNAFMSEFTQIVISQNNERLQHYQNEMMKIGIKAQEKAQLLMQQMRSELNAI